MKLYFIVSALFIFSAFPAHADTSMIDRIINFQVWGNKELAAQMYEATSKKNNYTIEFNSKMSDDEIIETLSVKYKKEVERNSKMSSVPCSLIFERRAKYPSQVIVFGEIEVVKSQCLSL